MSPALTGWALILLLALVAGADWWLYCRGGTPVTISGVVRRLGERWPLFVGVLAFAMGVLFGHFFFGYCP